MLSSDLSRTPDVFGTGVKHDSWEICNEYVKSHSIDLCDSWRDEIEKLLIFAGLFSAVVTAFTLESYHAVQGDPAEMTVRLLETIVRQLDNMTNPQPTTIIDLNPQLEVPGSAKRVNTLWFLSLTLSLATVTAGILCLQWIRIYVRTTSLPGPPYESFVLHQMRYGGLKRWHVSKMVSSLPNLFVISVVLFAAGLVEVLWEVNQMAAIPVSVVVGLTFIFILVTSVLPTLQCCWLCVSSNARFSLCPYKSPQSWMLHGCMALLSRFISLFNSGQSDDYSRLFQTKGWERYDRCLWECQGTASKGRDIARGLLWVGETFFQNQRVLDAVCECLRTLELDIAVEASATWMDDRRTASIRKAQEQLQVLTSSPIEGTSQRGDVPPALIQQQLNQFMKVNSGGKSGPDQSQKKVLNVPSREYLQDLLVAYTLEHLVEKVGQRFMSPTLLQRRLDLFLKINEGGNVDSDVKCPVSWNNVALISREKRERTLQCISNILRESRAPCDVMHARSALPIIYSISTDDGARDPARTLITNALDALKGWLRNQPEDVFSEQDRMVVKLFDHWQKTGQGVSSAKSV